MFPPISRWQHVKYQSNQTTIFCNFLKRNQPNSLCFPQLFARGLSTTIIINSNHNRQLYTAIFRHNWPKSLFISVKGFCKRLISHNHIRQLYYAGLPHGQHEELFASTNSCEKIRHLQTCCRYKINYHSISKKNIFCKVFFVVVFVFIIFIDRKDRTVIKV